MGRIDVWVRTNGTNTRHRRENTAEKIQDRKHGRENTGEKTGEGTIEGESTPPL